MGNRLFVDIGLLFEANSTTRPNQVLIAPSERVAIACFLTPSGEWGSGGRGLLTYDLMVR